jgi:hypothetical protein
MYQEVTDKKRKITTQLKEYSSETPEWEESPIPESQNTHKKCMTNATIEDLSLICSQAEEPGDCALWSLLLLLIAGFKDRYGLV